MRQYKCLEMDGVGANPNNLFWQHLCGLIFSTKWIECLHDMPINGDGNFRLPFHFSRNEPVKDKCQMLFQHIQLFTDNLVPAAFGLPLNQSIQLTPDNSGTVTANAIDVRECANVFVVQDREDPVVGAVDAV